MRKSVFILIFIFQSFCGSSQSKGVVRFLIDNENGYFEVMLNDTLLIKNFKAILPAATYKAEIWSYGYDISETSFTVIPDSTIDVYVKLNRSDSYKAYEESYSKYRMSFHKFVTVPVSSSIAFSLLSTGFMLRAYDYKKQIFNGIENYNNAFQSDEIQDIKSTVDDLNNRYDRNRIGYYVTGSLAFASIVGTIISGTYFRNNFEEPVYSKTSPFNQRVGLYFNGSACTLKIRIG